MFSFGYEVERNVVLLNEPWHFSKALIVLKPFDGLEGPEGGCFLRLIFGLYEV